MMHLTGIASFGQRQGLQISKKALICALKRACQTEALAHPPSSAPLNFAGVATAVEVKVKALGARTATPTVIAPHVWAATKRRTTNAFLRKNRTAEAVRPPLSAPLAPAEAEIAATAMVKVPAAPTAIQAGTATHAHQAIT